MLKGLADWYQLPIVLRALGVSPAPFENQALAEYLDSKYSDVIQAVNNPSAFNPKYIVAYEEVMGPNSVAPFTGPYW